MQFPYTYILFVYSKKLADCAGHFGYVQLELPLFHAGYFRHTLIILQCICKRCARVILPPVERQEFLKKMRNPKIDALTRSSIYKKIVDICKHGSMCPYCKYPNGKPALPLPVCLLSFLTLALTLSRRGGEEAHRRVFQDRP